MEEKQIDEKKAKVKGKRVSSSEMPGRTLEESIAVAKVIYDNFAGGDTPIETIASILGIGKKSTNLTYVTSAAEAYGIVSSVDGNKLKLTELGRKLLAPTYRSEDLEARRQAILTPTLLSRFYADYNKHPVPEGQIFLNALEHKYEVPASKTTEFRDIIISNAEYANIIQKQNDIQIINLELPINNAAKTEIPKQIKEVEPISNTIPVENEKDETDEISNFSKVCFVISPIGSDDSNERKHANMILQHLISPVCEELGLEVIRADKIDKSGLITQQIFEYIVKSGFCIADLSFNNPNVFYELGVRHVCQLPTVQIIRKGDKIPFDVAQGRTITVDTSDVYTIMDRIQSAQRELKEHLSKQINSKDIGEDNPIRYYLPDLKITLPK